MWTRCVKAVDVLQPRRLRIRDDESGPIHVRQPLRLWPGIAAAVLLVLYTLFLPLAGGVGGGPPALFLGGLVGGVLIILWWLLSAGLAGSTGSLCRR